MTAVDAAPSRAAGTERGIRLALAGLLGLLVVTVAHLVLAYMRHWLNEDHTILWFAARDLGHLTFPQPSYYGAAYFSVFEAAPAEALRRAGVPLGTAVFVSTATLMTIGWVWFALVAWRRGRFAMAAAALAVPVVITTEFLVSADSPGGRGAGTFCAMTGVAILLFAPARPVPIALFALLGGLGTLWDFGSALLVVPVGVYMLALNWRRWRVLAWGAIGSVVPLAFALGQRAFYADHPDYNVHRAAGFMPKLSILRDTIREPGRYFAWLSPELSRTSVVPIVAGAILLFFLARTRRAEVILPGVALVAIVLFSLSTPKALDGTPSVYVGYGRYFLSVPAALWFLGWVLTEARPPSPRLQRRLVYGIAAFAVVTFAVRLVTFDDRTGDIRRVAADPARAGAPVFAADAVAARCDAVEHAADRAGVDYVVFRGDRVGAYACAARDYGTLETIHPIYDRRTWLLHDANEENRTKFLVTDVDEGWCINARAIVESCELDPVDSTIAVVTTAPQPVLETWRQLGEEIRPFDQ
ncbi:MAG TPA: hypothetical protein VFX21_10930 [Acidimicrobiia bacterium]|nr:hypothetical protein [Acidimicrobiia bacterium]